MGRYVEGVVYGVENLMEVVKFSMVKANYKVYVNAEEEFKANQGKSDLDFSDVRGQEHQAGNGSCSHSGHHRILIGPPGTGKTMLANDFQQSYHRLH